MKPRYVVMPDEVLEYKYYILDTRTDKRLVPEYFNEEQAKKEAKRLNRQERRP